MNTSKILYFAYGSNMLEERLLERTKSAIRRQPYAVAFGHKLLWHKVSEDGSGKCDLIKTKNKTDLVYGALFSLNADELLELDKFEGLGKGYERANINVDCGGSSVTAICYIATSINPSLKPYTWYRDLVLAGAMQNKLPSDYIASIEQVDANEDPKPERKTRLKALELIKTFYESFAADLSSNRN